MSEHILHFVTPKGAGVVPSRTKYKLRLTAQKIQTDSNNPLYQQRLEQLVSMMCAKVVAVHTILARRNQSSCKCAVTLPCSSQPGNNSSDKELIATNWEADGHTPKSNPGMKQVINHAKTNQSNKIETVFFNTASLVNMIPKRYWARPFKQ